MKISLKELIETGRFGPVELGMNRAQVESALGLPETTGGTSRKYRKPLIGKYGDVELHFVQGADNLWLIHLDYFDVPSGGTLFELDPWIIQSSLTLSEAEECLIQNGIKCEVTDWPPEDNVKCLTAGAGVKVFFYMNEPNPLKAFSYSQRKA